MSFHRRCSEWGDHQYGWFQFDAWFDCNGLLSHKLYRHYFFVYHLSSLKQFLDIVYISVSCILGKLPFLPLITTKPWTSLPFVDPLMAAFVLKFFLTPFWVNPSKRGGMDGVFWGLAGLLQGISRGRIPTEILRSSPASPRKAPSIPTLLLGFTFYLK